MGDVTHYAGDQCPGGHYEETDVSEAMTDDELAAIEAGDQRALAAARPFGRGALVGAEADRHDLLAEVRRLRADLERAQLRSIEARNPGSDMERVKRELDLDLFGDNRE